MMAVSPLGCPSIMDQSFIINVTPTSDNRHTHTHTQREREGERLLLDEASVKAQQAESEKGH